MALVQSAIASKRIAQPHKSVRGYGVARRLPASEEYPFFVVGGKPIKKMEKPF